MKIKTLFLFFFTVGFIFLTLIGQSQSSNTSIYIGKISIEGNKRTKDYIVARELSFLVGDRLSEEQLNEEILKSKSNLINSSLYNFVEINSEINKDTATISIIVTERWYIWPIPIFEYADPNFNTWWQTKDFTRTNYGINMRWRNFRGRNQELHVNGQWGYSKDIGIYFFNPLLFRNKKLGGGFKTSYTQNEQITISTHNNIRDFYTHDGGNARDQFNATLFTSWRGGFFNSHILAVAFNSDNVNDSVTRITNDYFVNNQNYMQYLSWYYTFRHTQLDNKDYPLEGRYIQGDISWNGFPLMPDNNLMVIAFKFSYKSYLQLAKNIYFAGNVKAKYTPTKNLPYYFQQGLGYNSEFVRGYEYYILDGQNFLLYKSNVKFKLFKSKVHSVGFLKNTGYHKVHYGGYMNINLDAGYVFDIRYADQNPLNNSLIYGAGIGMDIVAFYDKVVRFEYSLNKELEHGFYIHFVKPI